MKLEEVLDGVNVRIKNNYTTSQKILWLNEVHCEFYDFVKMPGVHMANVSSGGFTVPENAREKDISTLMVNSDRYESLAFAKDFNTKKNYYLIADGKITLEPPPPNGSKVFMKYHKAPTKSYATNELSIELEQPVEYHWVYILGIAARVAKAQGDVTLANNLDADYKNGLRMAQQNYGMVSSDGK